MGKQKIDIDRIFGELYADSDQVLNLAVADTYYQIVGLSDGELENITSSSSRLTVNDSGYYSINLSASFAYATVNSTIHYSLFVDGVENTKLEIERKIATAGDVGNASGNAIVSLTAGQIIDIRAKCSSNTGNLTTTHFNLSVYRL